MTACGEQAADCKLEDVKDVKVSPKYLQCDQYPWYRSRRLSYEDRKKSYIRIFHADDVNRNVFRDVSTPHEVNNPGPSFGSGCAWSVDGFLHQDRATGDASAGKNHGSMILADKNPVIAPSSNESSYNMYQRGTCLPEGPPSEGYAGPDTLEKIRMGYERLHASCSGERPLLNEDVLAGRSGGESCGTTRDECPYRSTMPLSSLQCGTATGQTRSFEMLDYASQTSAGEDLSCGESCCRWRTARRHVANRVIASPWRQIVRPHHSPRTPRPIPLPQRHTDDVSTRQANISPRVRLEIVDQYEISRLD